MGNIRRTYIPAAGHDWLLPLYDPLQRWLGVESAKRQLIDQARLESGHRVLDVGCGTGTLILLIRRLHSRVEVLGLDPDPKALSRARRKSEQAGLSVRFDRGFSEELPYHDASFDRVFSSFMFHHLNRDQKLRTLREVRRVLKPGGSLHLLDFGRPRSRFARVIAQILFRGEQTRDNIEGRIPAFMSDAGLTDPEEIAHRDTVVGSISYYRACRRADERGDFGSRMLK